MPSETLDAQQRLAWGYGGDSAPAEEPEAKALREPTAPSEIDWNPSDKLYFIFAQNELHVAPIPLDNLIEQIGLPPDYKGPMAFGNIHIDLGKATFELTSNIHAGGIAKILENWAHQENLNFGGINDEMGSPIHENLKGASTIYYQYAPEGSLRLSKALPNKFDGALHIEHGLLFRRALSASYLPALEEFAQDNNLQIVSGDNTIKVVEDMEEKNIYSPEWNDEDDHFTHYPMDNEPPLKGKVQCGQCHQYFDDINALIAHKKNDEESWEEPNPSAPMSIDHRAPDMDDLLPFKYVENKGLITEGSTNQVQSPINFIYDIKQDQIQLGSPTEQTNPPGEFTVDSILGVYRPDGAIVLNSISNFSVSVRHFLDLWIYSQPNLPIKSVWLYDGSEQETKLA